ncbi:nucleolar RNA-binding Nop10p family protein [archaeon]|nr:nucleolar RNA-binding Nop10p family protein [archaeon]
MTVMIKRCVKCGYTMRDVCSLCNAKTSTAHPPKFSISDKYAKYRRIAKART